MLYKFNVSGILLFFLYRFHRLFSDEQYLKIKFFIKNKKRLDLKNPKSFGEKLQWLKLYDRQPLYTKMVDKVAVKDLVAQKIGKEYIIPTIAVYDSPDEINLDSLPNKFVIKCNHNSGKGMVICHDKSSLNIEKVKKGLKEGLKEDYYATSKEWPYKDVPRKIIVEEFISNGIDCDLPDYKWYCFNGEPKYCQVIRDRNTNETIDFYDTKWTHQEFVGLNPNVTNGKIPVPKPRQLSEMIEIARNLSKGIPFVRVDLYDTGKNIYFGELTFYPASGFGEFNPLKWDNKISELLPLPTPNADRV